MLDPAKDADLWILIWEDFHRVTEVIEYRVRSKTIEKMCDDDNLKILFPNRTYSTDIIRTQYFIILSDKSLGDDTLNQNRSKVFMMIRKIRDVDQDDKKTRHKFTDQLFFQIHISNSLLN